MSTVRRAMRLLLYVTDITMQVNIHEMETILMTGVFISISAIPKPHNIASNVTHMGLFSIQY